MPPENQMKLDLHLLLSCMMLPFSNKVGISAALLQQQEKERILLEIAIPLPKMHLPEHYPAAFPNFEVINISTP